MQVSLRPECMTSRPISDVEKLETELNRIKEILHTIDNTKPDFNYTPLLESLQSTNELVHQVDNANDFYKIGGFDLLPNLLNLPEVKIRAATAELIADLVQNNTFCQCKLLETGLAADLLKLLKNDQDTTVCIKALYALSCLCRNNHEAVVCLEKLEALPALLQAVQSPVEKLRTKAAFLLSHLVVFEPSIRNALYEVGFVQKLAELIKEDRNSSQEHLLSVLFTLVQHHAPSKALTSNIHSLRKVLEENMKVYEGKDEYQETRDYTAQVLKLCFSE